MKTLLQKFHADQTGATMVEYSVLLALIAIVCILSIKFVGIESLHFWTNSADAIQSVIQN